MTQQLDPLAAATHRDPYPYYAELVAAKPLYYDDALGMWVASSAEMVTAVLSAPLCRVRPIAEPVPKTLLGSPAGEIFRHLVRMNDGASHCPFKQAVSATLAAASMAHAVELSERWARVLAARYCTDASERLADFAFDLPVYVVGSLLGVPGDLLPQVARWTGDFVRCLAPAGSVEQPGQQAAARLRDTFVSLLQAQRAQAATGLLATLEREASRVGWADRDSIVANAIGFLSQAYEATAGLIGNTLLLLAARDELRHAISARPDALGNIIQEVLRYDPPVQNTRRFVAHDGVIAGQDMRAGATILVVLAAANRDPRANPDPAAFDPWRKEPRLFTFGLGAHACPGEALAPLIARAGVEQLMASGIWPDLGPAVAYRASTNARVPLIGRYSR
jgi:cytochrome P450